MRVAWFDPAAATTLWDASDAAALAAELGSRHHIDRFDARTAHEFVWRHARAPYDLTVFELGDTPAHAFIWAYLFHYPGVLVLNAESLQPSRTEALSRAWRRDDLRVERAFRHGDFLDAPLLSARLVVVHDEATAHELRQRVPAVHVRTVPLGVRPVAHHPSTGDPGFVVAGNRQAVAHRAADRARGAGAGLRLRRAPVPPRAESATATESTEADVAIALEWPPTGAPPVAALRAMAAGLPVIVFETEAIAAWPTLDPQTWQLRGYLTGAAPIAVSIDPRDEEHSLMLAMRRLAADAALRARLADAGQRWAREHASVRAAAAVWDQVLAEARDRQPVLHARDLPPHLTADGTAAARSILRELGATVDFLDDGVNGRS